jgi:hypothetical protein
LEGGAPQKVDEKGVAAAWSPDGNYLYYQIDLQGGGGLIVDLRSGKKSAVPASAKMFGFWLTQDFLVASNRGNLRTFNLESRKWTNLVPGNLGVVDFMMSPDGRYLYFTTGGAEPKVFRLRITDRQIEPITSLKDVHRAMNYGETQINVAPDGSPVFTRDTGYQEIYALNVRGPDDDAGVVGVVR